MKRRVFLKKAVTVFGVACIFRSLMVNMSSFCSEKMSKEELVARAIETPEGRSALAEAMISLIQPAN